MLRVFEEVNECREFRRTIYRGERMKRVLLKNKKTGIIGELSVTNRIVVYEPDMPLCGNSILGEYDTLAGLNKEWEDCKLAEPLIKDEKIRKAIRAWAEANRIGRALYVDYDYRFIAINNDSSSMIDFGNIPEYEKLKNGKTYTITELCGEDENE